MKLSYCRVKLKLERFSVVYLPLCNSVFDGEVLRLVSLVSLYRLMLKHDICKIDTYRLKRGTVLRCRVTEHKILGYSQILLVESG